MAECESPADPYALMLRALSLIPLSHYLLALAAMMVVFLYDFLELHFLQDLLTGFQGCPVALTFHSSSHIYKGVVSKCSILHGRYFPTPWLSSPHLQTVFLNFFGITPKFSYTRNVFRTSDGGTVALDWLMSYDVHDGGFQTTGALPRDDSTPIVLVIPGLTSDSQSHYMRHLAYNTAKSGWNVVVSNHRGLGGVSITSDCFYNAGWTEDLREITNHLQQEYPKAPLFLVGTSIGANVLVKYLGEDGDNIPIAGAVAICSPWDLLIGDRFIRRRFAQTFYDKALTIGLQGYAQLHEPHYSRLANWEGILKSRTIRDFDHHATRLVGKYETVDTYYRRCSSASYVGNVSVPLLCISAVDDPVCTKEAIPWDECRANKNVVLATVKHGGHLAFFEGLTASRLWWVRVTNEYIRVLHSSRYMHVKSKTPNIAPQSLLDSAVDRGPFVSVAEDGMLVAMANEQTEDNSIEESSEPHDDCRHEETEPVLVADLDEPSTEPKPHLERVSGQVTSDQDSKPLDTASLVKRSFDLLRRQNRYSLWLLAYIAVATSWPFLGSILNVLYRKKLRNALPAALLRS